MKNNIKPGEAYNFANCHVVSGVVKRGGMARRPNFPETLSELSGGRGNN